MLIIFTPRKLSRSSGPWFVHMYIHSIFFFSWEKYFLLISCLWTSNIFRTGNTWRFDIRHPASNKSFVDLTQFIFSFEKSENLRNAILDNLPSKWFFYRYAQLCQTNRSTELCNLSKGDWVTGGFQILFECKIRSSTFY